jgi:hypothetical protein
MRQIVDALRQWGFNICSTFLMDTQFCLDSDKFLAAALTSLSSIVALETPAINVLSKMVSFFGNRTFSNDFISLRGNELNSILNV